MNITKMNLSFCTLALASMCGLTAVADDSKQSHNGHNNQQQSQSDRESKNNADADHQSQDNRSQKSQSDKKQSQKNQSQMKQSRQRTSPSGGNTQVEPVGWITVASDYNHDGFYDAVETIYYYDLKEARDKSRQRSQDGSQSSSNTNQAAQRASIQGQITSLKTEQSDSGQTRLIAKVENNEGRTVHVCLGPKDQLSQLNLSQGDRVSADGLLTRKDGERVLLATKVSANGKSVQQKLSQRSSINRVEGTLKSLREARSKRGDGTYLVGEVKTNNGTQKIHFGPKKQLSKLQLSEGDDIKVLTTSGKVSGKQAKLAVQVTANDQTAKITRSQQQSRDSQNKDMDANRNRSDS